MDNEVPSDVGEDTPFELHIKYSNRDCNLSQLNLSYDEACLQIFSSVPYPVIIKAKLDECYQCAFVPWANVSEGYSTLILSTTYKTQYIYQLNGASCSINIPFAENGIYALNVTENSCGDVKTVLKPNNIYYPILVAVVIAILAQILWKILLNVWDSNLVNNWRQRTNQRSELESDLGRTLPDDTNISYSQELQTIRRRLQTRVKALDTFRGISIAVMIFVNYGGGKYSIFGHSSWNGLTVADLVFPWFAWIMGVSIAVSLRSHLRSSTTRKKLFLHVLRRSLWLFTLGLLLNTFAGHRNGFNDIRIFGVLQRLGLSYFIVAGLETFLMKPQGMVIDGIFVHIREILECWQQWMIMLIIIACHTCLTLLLKVPNCPVGYLGPGGLNRHGLYWNCTGGTAGYIDRTILGEKHMYHNPTSIKVYKTSIPFDPEGILGTMTTVFLVHLGVQAGRILMTYSGSASRILRLLMWSAFTGILAGFLCKFSKDKGIIPVNKNLWSLSFVLVTASTAFFIKLLLFFMIDVKKWWSGSPFIFAGMNPLLLYVGHMLTYGMFPWFWQPLYNTHSELLAMNLCGSALWVLISYCLYRYNIFLSL